MEAGNAFFGDRDVYLFGAGAVGAKLFHSFASRRWPVKAFLDSNRALHGETVLGVPVLDAAGFLSKPPANSFIIIAAAPPYDAEIESLCLKAGFVEGRDYLPYHPLLESALMFLHGASAAIGKESDGVPYEKLKILFQSISSEVRRKLELQYFASSSYREEDCLKLNEFARLRTEFGKRHPDCPVCKSWKTFSQSDEDGIIRECLARIEKIAKLDGTFIEFACGDGLQSNTHQLLLDGYRGVWLDRDETHIRKIDENLGGLEFDNLKVYQETLTLENMETVLNKVMRDMRISDPDVFSLDVDGNDLYFAKTIAEMARPKLLVVEYNGKFPPPISLSIPYDEKFVYRGDDYHGASLQKFVDELSGYTLVCCNLSGVNAFFVRNEFCGNFPVIPVEDLYMPPRLWLATIAPYHPPSYKWLRQTLNKPGRQG